MSEDSSYHDALVIAGEHLPEAVRVLPYARHVYAAYQWLRDRRFKAFLTSLNGAAADLSREERERFDAYINSECGGEILADFAEQAVRTRSRTALAALAILYAHPDADAERKAQTALALDGVSERSLDCFLLLWRQRADLRREKMELATISDATVESHSTLNAAGWSDDAWVAAVDDLIARGLLGADPSAAGRLGGGERWSRHFRFTSDSEWFERLLERARACLNTQTILGG